MDQDAKEFIQDWIRENINPETYSPPEDDSRARELADQCRTDAKSEGITNQEIDAVVAGMIGGGDGLVALINDAMENVTDDEVDCLAEKDD